MSLAGISHPQNQAIITCGTAYVILEKLCCVMGNLNVGVPHFATIHIKAFSYAINVKNIADLGQNALRVTVLGPDPGHSEMLCTLHTIRCSPRAGFFSRVQEYPLIEMRLKNTIHSPVRLRYELFII